MTTEVQDPQSAGGARRVVRVTRSHVAAAQLREALDERLGRPTPAWVKRLARLEGKNR